mgnify:CR=1 FL=1
MQTPELTQMQIALAPQSAASVRAWTTGQILQATVVRQSLDGTLTLRVGQAEVQAKTGLTLAADQPLTLQVQQAGQKVVLRILNASNADATTPQPMLSPRAESAPPEQAVLTQAWRQVLPRTGDLRPLLQQINQHVQPQPNVNTNAGASTGATSATPAQAPALASTPLPPQVLSALRQLLAQFPTPANLGTASGLRRAIADSGLFLENHLAQAAQQGTPPPVQHDLKATLTQLVATLRAHQPPAPPAGNAPATSAPATPTTSTPLGALLQQADAALARIEQHQLVALSQTSTSQPPPLIVEVPVRAEPQPEVMKFIIEEEPGTAQGSTAKQWNVWLRFDFEALGHVEARVALMGESVSVSLWAEQPATTTLFNDHLAELDQTLQQAGLAPTLLPCQSGRPKKPGTDEPAPQRLLDERA